MLDSDDCLVDVFAKDNNGDNNRENKLPETDSTGCEAYERQGWGQEIAPAPYTRFGLPSKIWEGI